MSEQPPLASPSGPSAQDPSFEPYAAPAYGDVSPEPGTEPTLMAPQPPQAPPPPYPSSTPYPSAPYPSAPYPSASYPSAPYPSAPYPQPYQVAPQYLAAPTHPTATTSLVLGIIGITGIVLTPFFLVTVVAGICSPFAIWLGVRSRREIRNDPQRYGGEGIATAGFVTGIVGLVLGILALLLVIAFVAFIAAVFSSTS